VRYWSLLLLMSAATASAASGPIAEASAQSAQSEKDGRSFFLACEFKRAARAFEKAVVQEPERAVLHYWLGKSYARMAEVSSPLTAPKNARKARRSLERAVQIDPKNEEYRRELIDFYLNSPEWFGGGLQRAAALVKESEVQESQLADSREDHSGASWWIEWAVLRTSGAIGHLARNQ